MKESSTILSLTNGQGVTITASVDHTMDGKPIGTGVASLTVTSADGDQTIGFQLNRENRRRLRATLDMMDLA